MNVRAGVCGVLVAMSVCFSAPAWTDTLVQTDPSGDVASFNGRKPGVATPAPKRRNGDIIGTRIVHSRRGLRVTIRFRELRRDGGSFTLIAIKSPRTQYYVELISGQGDYGGRARLADARDRRLSCPELAANIDYRRNLEHVQVPAGCIRRPRWVRVGVNDATSVNGFKTIYTDDSSTGQPMGTRAPVLSRRLYRGSAVIRVV